MISGQHQQEFWKSCVSVALLAEGQENVETLEQCLKEIAYRVSHLEVKAKLCVCVIILYMALSRCQHFPRNCPEPRACRAVFMCGSLSPTAVEFLRLEMCHGQF